MYVKLLQLFFTPFGYMEFSASCFSNNSILMLSWTLNTG